MQTLEQIASKKNCGGSVAINTGKLGCLQYLSTPEHVIAVKKGFKIPKETVLNDAYIRPLVQKGTFIPR